MKHVFYVTLACLLVPVLCSVSSCSLKKLNDSEREKIKNIMIEFDVRSPVKPIYSSNVAAATSSLGVVGLAVGGSIDGSAKKSNEDKMKPLDEFIEMHNINSYIPKSIIAGLTEKTNYVLINAQNKNNLDKKSTSNLSANNHDSAYLKLVLYLNLDSGLSFISMSARLSMYNIIDNGKLGNEIYVGRLAYQSLPIVTEKTMTASKDLKPAMESWSKSDHKNYPSVLVDKLHNARMKSWTADDGKILMKVIKEAISELTTMISIELGDAHNLRDVKKTYKNLIAINQIMPGASSGGEYIEGPVISSNKTRYIIRKQDGTLYSLSEDMIKYAQLPEK